jgi:hypothetical protein
MGTFLVPSFSTIWGLIKFLVALLSKRALYVANFFALIKMNGTSSVLFFIIQQIWIVQAQIMAAKFKPPKNPLIQSSHPWLL